MVRLLKIAKAAAACVMAAALPALMCVSASGENGFDEPPGTSAYAYSLYCANNGEFLAEKNGGERLPMASTTKIMTAVLALEAEQSGEAESVRMSSDYYSEGSSMYLSDGETISLRDAVGGMMMVSGNDAANAIAVTIGGSIEGFAYRMNDKAAELGLRDTHFVNPSGLDSDGHFTTADELCRLMAYCMDNAAFAETVGSRSVTVSFIEPQGKEQTYYNENKLLGRYEYCIGGKTGYTDKAGRTLVSCAEKDGVRLVCATLGDPDDWNDHEALFEYGFSRLTAETPDIDDKRLTAAVAGGESDSVSCVCGEPPKVVAGSKDVTVVYELPQFVYAPVEEGQTIGRAKYYTGGVYAGCSDITAGGSVAADKTETTFLENTASWFRRLASRIARGGETLRKKLWRKEKWKIR